MPTKDATRTSSSKQRDEEAAAAELGVLASHKNDKAADATAKNLSLADRKAAEVKELHDLNSLLQAELDGLPKMTTVSLDEGTFAEESNGSARMSRESEKLTFAILETAKKLHVANREKERIVHAKYAEILEAGKRAKSVAEKLIEESSKEAERIKAAALESTNRLLSESKRDAALTKQKAHQLAAEVKKKAEEEAQRLKNDAEMASKEIAMAAEKQSTDIVAGAEASALKIIEAATDEQATVRREKTEWEKEKLSVKQSHKFDSTKVLVDVGGSHFSTRLSTLTSGAAEGSMLSAMFSGRHALDQDEKDGSYFIDRDGTYFALVLNYLRDPSDFEDPKSDDVRRALEKEAQYYQIESLQFALLYLPVAVFEASPEMNRGAARNDILSHLNRKGKRIILQAAPSGDLILLGSMREALASAIRTHSSTKGQQLSISHFSVALSGQINGTQPRQQRTLLSIDFGDNMVCYSSLLLRLRSIGTSQVPQLNCMIALIDADDASTSTILSPDCRPYSGGSDLEYKIECSAPNDTWTSKIFIMLEVPNSSNIGAMNAPRGRSTVVGPLNGLKLFGKLREIRHTDEMSGLTGSAAGSVGRAASWDPYDGF